jgi:hypothetical protein
LHNSTLGKWRRLVFEQAQNPSSKTSASDTLRRRLCERKAGDISLFPFSFNDKLRELGGSCRQAERRFLNMERKLRIDFNARLQCGNFVRQYLSLGHMSVADPNPDYENGYYQQHHTEFKGFSTTTKIRVYLTIRLDRPPEFR